MSPALPSYILLIFTLTFFSNILYFKQEAFKFELLKKIPYNTVFFVFNAPIKVHFFSLFIYRANFLVLDVILIHQFSPCLKFACLEDYFEKPVSIS